MSAANVGIYCVDIIAYSAYHFFNKVGRTMMSNNAIAVDTDTRFARAG
jgi:hypothetical protein